MSDEQSKDVRCGLIPGTSEFDAQPLTTSEGRVLHQQLQAVLQGQQRMQEMFDRLLSRLDANIDIQRETLDDRRKTLRCPECDQRISVDELAPGGLADPEYYPICARCAGFVSLDNERVAESTRRAIASSLRDVFGCSEEEIQQEFVKERAAFGGLSADDLLLAGKTDAVQEWFSQSLKRARKEQE